MTLKLKQIEISNLRRHSYVNFEPETEGITAISGPNGTGKSTLVDSIAWVLYGTKPLGVNKVSEMYRADAVFGEDKCFARVLFELDGQLLKVERRMTTKGGAVEADVWEKRPEEDDEAYVHVAGSSVSHTESYIRKRLKMDEKGFLSAILVQQKQVDQLIAAKPRERASVIEKLTGISSITAGLVEARQDYNTLRKVASVSSVDEDELSRLRAEAETLVTTLEAETSTIAADEEELSAVTANGKKLKQEVEAASAAQREAEELQQEALEIKTRSETLSENLTYLIQEKDEKKERLSRLAAAVDLAEVEEKLSTARGELRMSERERDERTRRISAITATVETARELVDKATFKTLDEAQAGQAKVLAKFERLQEEISRERTRRTEFLSDAKKYRRAAEVISEEHGSCPTCLQHVEDVPAAVTALEEQEQAALTQAEELAETLERLANHLKASEEVQRKFLQLLEAIGRLSTSQEELASVRAEEANFAADARQKLSEVQALEKLHLEAKGQDETKRAYRDLLTRAQKTSEELDRLGARGDEVKKLLSARGAVSSKKLDRMRRNLDEAKTHHNDLTVKLTQARGEVKTLTERQKFVSEKIDMHSAAIAKYKDLLKSVEVASSTVSLLDEFRENRIKNSIPLLEVYASDLLNRFTAGKFSRLIIDGKFNTTVVLADGTERAVGLLSGGELSAAAIALRIGVAMLLHSGSSSNLIILDEVLVSQDTERAELILSTIKDVCQGQVLLIAHNDAIDAIADKVFDMGAIPA
jgi:DNA repair exonuclease SbcCD ATPase subunit